MKNDIEIIDEIFKADGPQEPVVLQGYFKQHPAFMPELLDAVIQGVAEKTRRSGAVDVTPQQYMLAVSISMVNIGFFVGRKFAEMKTLEAMCADEN